MKLTIFFRKIRSAIRHYHAYGFKETFKLARHRLRADRQGTSVRSDIMCLYKFVEFREVPPSGSTALVGSKTINWVIPPFGKGSGGHLNIFRFIFNLEQLGYTCRVIVVGVPQPVSADQIRREIREWFFPLQAQVFCGLDGAPSAEFTVATEWRTAYWVRSFVDTTHRCYFVQDFEPWFFPVGSESIFAEETYRFGFVGITAGDWLREKLAKEYSMATYSVGFSYDKELYRPHPRRDDLDNSQRIFFYARPPTPRRAFELGLLVLAEVVRRRPQVQVVFAGWDVSNFTIPFAHLNAGLLSVAELPDLYSQCDVALVLSLTNLSLLPLELMACGTPVVSNDASWTRWLLNETNCKLARPTVAELSDALCAVLDDPEEAERLREGGYSTVAGTDWLTEAKKMSQIFDEISARSKSLVENGDE